MNRTCLLLAALLVAPPALLEGKSRYEGLYGTPVEVSIADLLTGGFAYTNRAIRTHGRLDLQSSGGRIYVLRDMFSYSMPISPLAEIAQEFESEARFHLGQELIVTGVLQELPSQSGTGIESTYVIQFWHFEIPPDPNKERIAKAKIVSIDSLVSSPGRYDGQTIRVVGTFRGRNLFGDLPPRSERNRSDLVLLDGEEAVWVTGKKPKGSGWQLDPSLKRDTGKWIEVLGRPETKQGVTYVRAERLSLVPPPPKAVATASPPPLPDKPKAPPIVVFSLPLDGESDVPADSRFVVQFSKDMDESTFADRVQLRYLGPARAGLRPLEAVSFAYDPGRRALTVDPGDRLGRGTEVELRLLPGIKDVDGLELVPRTGQAAADGAPVDVLHYRVGT